MSLARTAAALDRVQLPTAGQGLALQLSRIVGLSPLNVRTAAPVPGDARTMAASLRAVGQLQPIIVRDDGRGWEVLDGGRRWAGFRLLVEQGVLDVDDDIAVVVDDRPEAEAREASLSANVVRRQLHPVEEFEAFAQLVRDGLPVERIAADFDVESRYVRQRLALDKLSPRVREAWRDGRFTADVAAAFTIAGKDAQDALLDAHPAWHWIWRNPRDVRHTLAKEALPANSPEALYVGLDAYAAAGGAIDDNLFEDFSLCLDGALLKRLARARMIADGEALMERQGYGFVAIRDEVEQHYNWTRLPHEYTAAEKERLAAIDAEQEALDAPIEGEDEDRAAALDAAYNRLDEERDAIEARAAQRAGTAAQRALAGILLSLDREGKLVADMGRVPPKTDKSERVANSRLADLPRDDDPAPASAKAAPAPEDEKKPGTALITVIDAARTAAFARLVAERPYLAILILTATLNTRGNRSPVRIEVACRTDAATEPMRSFTEAATAQLGETTNRDALLVHLAHAVAGTILVRPEKAWGHTTHSALADATDTEALATLVAAHSGAAYEATMRRALDYDAYFKAATRDAAIAAVTAAEGDVNHARTLKKPELAAFAASLCGDKGWLPRELRTPDVKPVAAADAAPSPVMTVADAMATALDADDPDGFAETSPPDGAELVAGPASLADEAAAGPYSVSAFLTEACEPAAGARTKTAVLFDLYRAQAGERHPEAATIQAFAAAIADHGFGTHRLKTGVYVLDLCPVGRAA